MDKFKAIGDYLKHLTENYDLRIVVNDFVGFLSWDNSLLEVFSPYMIHSNSFCMRIKSQRELWDKCLSMKHRILKRSEFEKDVYLGMCYCGVGEYIVPIICNNIVFGVICVGTFCIDAFKAELRIKRIARDHGFDAEDLLDKYSSSVKKEAPDAYLIKSILGILSAYLSNYCYNSMPAQEALTQYRPLKLSSERYILSHAIEYIKLHFTERIYVSHIASFCHCSESYINHIFKKNVGSNIKEFINKLRIEHAKTCLIESYDSIAEISCKVGFDDPNYFSTVFSRITGLSPTAYRNKHKIV